MTDIHDFQDNGDAARRAAGIDGTAGDAQDIRHRFVADDQTGACLLCGLAPSFRKHIDRLLDCGLCYEEHGEEVHPHPECPIGYTRATKGVRGDETSVGPHKFAPKGWRRWICRHCYGPRALHPRTGWVRARPVGDNRYISANAPHFHEGW